MEDTNVELRAAYSVQRSRAAQRGIEWLFTFDEWVEVWRNSGRLSERGRGRGRYVMARRGDVGPYSVANVVIQLGEDNSREYAANHQGKASVSGIARLGRGLGWSFVKGRYQVACARVYVGRFRTQEAAEAAYSEAVQKRRAHWCGVHGETNVAHALRNCTEENGARVLCGGAHRNRP